jgi:very-short-patch-repair endonuclease
MGGVKRGLPAALMEMSHPSAGVGASVSRVTAPSSPHTADAVGGTSPMPLTISHGSSTTTARARSAAPEGNHDARAVRVLGVSEKIIVSGSRDARIAAIAEHQRGRVSRRQLLVGGLSKSQIHHLTATDRLFRMHAGVYAVGHPGEVPLGRETAALLAARDNAVLSHASAAPLWGIDAIDPDPDLVHLLVDARADTRRSGIRAHRSRTLRPVDRRVRMGLPVCAPARMLLDLAADVGDRVLERAVDQALILAVVTHREILDVVSRTGGHRGIRALRDLAEDHPGATFTRSEAEERLLALIRAGGLPEPCVNARIDDEEVDFLWPQAKLVVEVDGYRFHSTRAAFERDRLRDARLHAKGFEVMRITWRRLERDRLALLVDIASALARRMPRHVLDVMEPAVERA